MASLLEVHVITGIIFIVACTSGLDQSTLVSGPGHYPGPYCSLSNAVLVSTKGTFMYKFKETSDESSFREQCTLSLGVWKFEELNQANAGIKCDMHYNEGHVFTIYYNGGSNYFHLHWDMMLPLYVATRNQQNATVAFMPSVESKRMQVFVHVIP